MTVDSFTANLLLSQVGKVPNDSLADMAKELSKVEGGPSKEAIAWFEENKGKEVSVKGTSHIAIVKSLNESTAGLYHGGRYPIYVELINGNYAGSVFEYEVEQLTVTSPCGDKANAYE